MVAISNVNNKYQVAEESTFGTAPGTFTALDFGQIQNINIGEEENMEKISSINGGHTANLFEDGLYWANVSIETLVTKASLPILLEACMGARADTADYAITSSTDFKSYSMKVNFDPTQIITLNGLAVKDWSIDLAKGESVSLTMNCLAVKSLASTATITTTKNTDKIFKDLDVDITVGGNALVLNSLSLSGNWNVTDDEGRGIEAVSAGDRRLLNTFIKHTFDVSGSYEAEVSTDLEFGYTEERSDEAIIVTIGRGTDNQHVFTMSNTRSGNRTLDLTTDNTKKVVSYDYEALDVSMAGDL